MENLSISKAQLLIKIFSQKDEDLNIQLNNALEWATKELGMDLGIISHIQNEIYSVKYFWPDSSGLEDGQSFELGTTYCSIAIMKDDVFSVGHMGISEFKDQPCYEVFHLESYIGKPFHLDGNLYGTINFSSENPKDGGFTEEELMFVRLLSGWISSSIHRLNIIQKLQDEHRLYKLITSNTGELICMHELNGNYTFVSPSVKNILGYSPRELIGVNPYNLFHPDDLERITEELHKTALEGIPYPSIEYRIRKKTDEYIWLDTATEPILNDEGKVIALQTTSREISDRKRIDILFQQSQKMANVGGWEYNLTSGRLYWTDEVYRIHELPIGTEVFVEDGISYYPEGWPRETLQSALNNTIENGDPTELELPFRTAKGNLKWIRTIINAEFEGFKATKLYGTFQDITKKKLMEELFKDSQEMANVGGWEFNIETGELFWTDEVYRIHELPIGTPVKVEDGLSYYPEGGSRETLQAAINHTILTGERYDLELPFVTAKGNDIWVRAIGHAELIDGKAVKMIGAFQNITRRKEQEEKIKSQVKQLSQLKSTREKLYSIIAHDLRNSIFGITGLLGLLIDEIKSDEIEKEDLAEKLSLVQMSADNSYKLLDNMLTWVKLQSGMLEVNPVEFNLQETLHSTLDLLQPSLNTKKIKVNQFIDTDTTIYSEQNLISTILRNLINNAIKFSEPESSIDVSVSTSEKDILSITVKDYGVGMDNSTIKNLFNSENRPQKDGTMHERGSGLGLILVKELVDLCKGTITAESNLGNGSKFVLKIPKKNNS